MADTGAAAKHWVFTLNNYTEDDFNLFMREDDDVEYVLVGRETAPDTGTPHLQGFLCLKVRRRIRWLKNKYGNRVHFEKRRGTVQQAVDYIKNKPNADFTELGEVPCMGKRNDLEAFKRSVRAGEHSMRQLRESHSMVCARYPSFVSQYVADHLPRTPMLGHPLMPWQQNLYNQLRLAPDDRKVTFIVDEVGNKGKSWFARYYYSLHSENTQILRPGPKKDMAHALDPICRVIIIDCARGDVEHFQYRILEEIKDGLVFASKYESVMKSMMPCHVVMLMNTYPDLHALSEDRYDIVHLTT